MKQPKDYEEISLEDFIKDEYKHLTFGQKIIYLMQDHVIKLSLTLVTVGYLAGMRFGVFW